MQAFILGIIQGITEFLPISSSAHLLIVPYLLDWPSLGLAFDVSLHIGTLLAVIIYFARRWQAIFINSFQDPKARLTLQNLIIATIPAACIGYWGESVIEYHLRHPLIAAINLILFALLLWAIDKRSREDGTVESLSWKSALLVGVFQAFALIPGVSRSGITITGGRSVGLTRTEATEFSFLLLAPITFGAALTQLPAIADIPDLSSVVIGIFASFVTGILAIHFMLKLLKSHGFMPYIYYRITIGLIFIALIALKQQ